MKNLVFGLALLSFTSQVVYAGNGTKSIVIPEDSSNQIQFKLSPMAKEQVKVQLKGITDELGTISLINNNGESIFFEFIDFEEQNFTFDLSQLEKGTYYIKLNANNEIRMKTIVVN